jgi:hypothetical protein
MPYLGKTMMGQQTPIPMNPVTGQIDINALVDQLVDQQKTYAYDTLTLAPGTQVANQPYQIFANPIGQADPYNGGLVKTELETNLTKPREFSAPTDFILNNLGFYFLPGNLLFDIEQIINHCWFEFKILKKVLWMGHLERHPSGMGLYGMSNNATDTFIQNGVPEPSKVWHFGDWRKYIPPETTFSLTLNFTETYDAIYNGAGSGGTGASANNIPATILSKLITPGQITSANRPTLLTQAAGGNGIKLICLMNGISNGPVQ